MLDNDQTSLDQFIATQLSKGVSIRDIEYMLQKKGWTAQQVDASLLRVTNGAQTRQTRPAVASDQSAVEHEQPIETTLLSVKTGHHDLVFWSKLKPLHKVVIVAFGAVIIGASGAAIVATTSRDDKPQAVAQNTVTDANYRLTLPNGWRSSQQDSSGAGMRLFQEGAGAQTYARVYVYQASAMTIDQHIAVQEVGLTQAQASVEPYDLAAVTATNQSGALSVDKTSQVQLANGAKQYYVTASVTKGDVLYVVDIVVPQGNTVAINKAIPKLLISFQPLSATLQPTR